MMQRVVVERKLQQVGEIEVEVGVEQVQVGEVLDEQTGELTPIFEPRPIMETRPIEEEVAVETLVDLTPEEVAQHEADAVAFRARTEAAQTRIEHGQQLLQSKRPDLAALRRFAAGTETAEDRSKAIAYLILKDRLDDLAEDLQK